jgi:hypothetical protein
VSEREGGREGERVREREGAEVMREQERETGRVRVAREARVGPRPAHAQASHGGARPPVRKGPLPWRWSGVGGR